MEPDRCVQRRRAGHTGAADRRHQRYARRARAEPCSRRRRHGYGDDEDAGAGVGERAAGGRPLIGGDPVLQPGRVSGQTGIDAASAELFKGATYCLVPSMGAGAAAIDTLSSFATMLGAKPYFIDAAEHDGLMTGVEHLPAALGLALLAATVRSRGWREMSKLAGESFRATTGLAPQDSATAREQFFAHAST